MTNSKKLAAAAKSPLAKGVTLLQRRGSFEPLRLVVDVVTAYNEAEDIWYVKLMQSPGLQGLRKGQYLVARREDIEGF